MLLLMAHESQQCGPFTISILQYVHCILYIIALQVTMAFISGVMSRPLYDPPTLRLDDRQWKVVDGLSIYNGSKVTDVIDTVKETNAHVEKRSAEETMPE